MANTECCHRKHTSRIDASLRQAGQEGKHHLCPGVEVFQSKRYARSVDGALARGRRAALLTERIQAPDPVQIEPAHYPSWLERGPELCLPEPVQLLKQAVPEFHRRHPANP